MDPKLKTFLDLVDCHPEEVKDIPMNRLRTSAQSPSERESIDPVERHQSLGQKVVFFGKHCGKKLKDLPRDYLDWALSERATNKSFRRFQRDAREFLSLGTNADACGSVAERLDPLTREFLAIVKSA